MVNIFCTESQSPPTAQCTCWQNAELNNKESVRVAVIKCCLLPLLLRHMRQPVLACRWTTWVSSVTCVSKKLGTCLPYLVVTWWREPSIWRRMSSDINAQQLLAYSSNSQSTIRFPTMPGWTTQTFLVWDSKTAATTVIIAKKPGVILESPTQWFYWVWGTDFWDKPKPKTANM